MAQRGWWGLWCEPAGVTALHAQRAHPGLDRTHQNPLQPAHLIACAGVGEEVLDGDLGSAGAAPQIRLVCCVCVLAVGAGCPDLLAHSPAAAQASAIW